MKTPTVTEALAAVEEAARRSLNPTEMRGVIEAVEAGRDLKQIVEDFTRSQPTVIIPTIRRPEPTGPPASVNEGTAAARQALGRSLDEYEQALVEHLCSEAGKTIEEITAWFERKRRMAEDAQRPRQEKTERFEATGSGTVRPVPGPGEEGFDAGQA